MSMIVLLATAWGSKQGGINVVNMELTRALVEVFGTTGRVHAEKPEVDDAQKSGAVLVSLGLDHSKLPDSFDPGWLGTAQKKLAEAGTSTVAWCVGHDAITDAAANAMKERGIPPTSVHNERTLLASLAWEHSATYGSAR
jgi:hypothetical protein